MASILTCQWSAREDENLFELAFCPISHQTFASEYSILQNMVEYWGTTLSAFSCALRYIHLNLSTKTWLRPQQRSKYNSIELSCSVSMYIMTFEMTLCTTLHLALNPTMKVFYCTSRKAMSALSTNRPVPLYSHKIIYSRCTRKRSWKYFLKRESVYFINYFSTLKWD
jgi:hypothetical protein